MSRKKSSGTLRYIFRQIFRSPGKSLLCLLLAVGFMMGLMLVRVSALHSEARLEELFNTITVDMEIIKSQAAMNIYTEETGFIRSNTVEKLMETGHVIHRYVEGEVSTEVVFRLDGSTGRRVDADRFGVVGLVLTGVEYPEEYLANQGGGSVAYREGYDDSVFLQPWDSEAEQPVYGVVVAQSLYEEFEMEEGDMLEVWVRNASGDSVRTDLTVIGIHPGQMSDLLMPLETLRNVPGVRLLYNQVVLTLDPASNRQLDEFKVQANSILAGGGTVPLTSLFWDQELRQAVQPMEQVISFMKTLYPVTVALSALVAVGIAVLLTLMSAKEAAILRVLGNSKARCRIILCLQTILVCVVGLIIGHLGAVGMARAVLTSEAAVGLTGPALQCTGLYLLATVLGTAGASVAMTTRNPLEMLQVKE